MMLSISPYGVTIPPSNLKQSLANLLESGKGRRGADVTFVVKREITCSLWRACNEVGCVSSGAFWRHEGELDTQ
jgi:hypothetical protein